MTIGFQLPGLVSPLRRRAPEPGGAMRPGPGEVLHFSEDPGITRFVPPFWDTVVTTTLR